MPCYTVLCHKLADEYTLLLLQIPEHLTVFKFDGKLTAYKANFVWDGSARSHWYSFTMECCPAAPIHTGYCNEVYQDNFMQFSDMCFW